MTPNVDMRESNIELLKILAMSMILIHHFMVHVLEKANVATEFVNLCNPWLYYGVNLFFMISGTFMVNCKIKSIIKLAAMVSFFNIINLAVLHILGADLSIVFIVRSILFPMTEAGYWFLMVYFFLIIISPVLNLGLRKMSDSELTGFVIVLVIANFYSNAFGFNFVNLDGYSFFQGMLMYILGYYLSRMRIHQNITKVACVITVIAVSTISGVTKEIQQIMPNAYFDILKSHLWNYNGVCMIGGSVAIMFLFKKIEFKSRMINSIASASLGCYLLQEGFVGCRFIYKWQRGYVLEHSIMDTIIMFGGTFVAFWA
ncbi:MAG: acyltransferase, partial [Duncaniella sp.]|nr:acyltransferase [Duncaniella sp.]